MNGRSFISRRVMSAAVATLAGLIATAAWATPAAAANDEDPEITIVVEAFSCKVNGTVQVVWDVINNLGFDVNLTAAEFTPAASTSSFVPNTELDDGEVLEVAQLLPDGTNSASMKVFWENVVGKEPAGDVTGQTEVVLECPALVKAEFTDNCDGTVTVKLINDDPQNGQSFTVNGVQHIVAPAATKTVDNVTPDGGGNVVVTINSLPVGSHHWTKPEDCPDLPQTGTPVTGLVATGVALVGTGVALLVAMVVWLRRRRATA